MQARALLAVLALAGCASPAPEAAPPSFSGDLASVAAGDAPGAGHDLLAGLAGEWTVTVEDPEGGAAGTGHARIRALHGGRFLRIEVALVLAGRPVELTGHLGRDGTSGEWQALWLSDLSTGMTLLRGRGDPARGVHLRGERDGVAGRSVWRVLGVGEMRFETWARGPDGRERLVRVSRYVRT